MRAGGVRGAIFAVFTPSAGATSEPLPRADGVLEFAPAPPVGQPVAAAHAGAAIDLLHALEDAGALRIARQAADLDAARAGGPPAAVLHLEGAEAIGPAAALARAGLEPNQRVRPRRPVRVPRLARSRPGPDRRRARARAALRAAAPARRPQPSQRVRLLGRRPPDAGPLVASHSGAHALSPCSRNLTDRQLDAIGASGGLVGIVFATPFLRADFADDPDTPIELIAEHARHVAQRIGVAHVALGSDFDGATVPAALREAAAIPLVLEALARTGFTEREIDTIAWENWRRVLGRAWNPC